MERVLTAAERNRALLARQGLLERSRVGLPEMLERMGTLQAQNAPSIYAGLHTRVEGVHRADVDAALEAREIVSATLMRGTIHLVSRDDYWPLAIATREAVRTTFRRVHGKGVSDAQLAAAVDAAREALRGRTMRRAELDALVGKQLTQLLMGMGLELVRAPPGGTWERRRADVLALADEWVGPCEATVEQGVRRVVERALGGFGPLSRQDIARYAGLRLRDVDPVLATMGLRSFGAEDGSPLLDLPSAPLPPGETPAPVRLIPPWDATLLSFARGGEVLPERHRGRFFTPKVPRSEAAVLVGGHVAGIWRLDGARVVLELFEALDVATRRELADEVARLEDFVS